jgi:hypothetical protein
VELITCVTVSGGRTSQYPGEVTVIVRGGDPCVSDLVTVIVFGGAALCPPDLVTSFVEMEVTVTVFGGSAGYPTDDVTVLVNVLG